MQIEICLRMQIEKNADRKQCRSNKLQIERILSLSVAYKLYFVYVGEKSNKNEVLIKKDSLDWLKGHLINRKKNSYQKYLAKMLARIVRIVQKED